MFRKDCFSKIFIELKKGNMIYNIVIQILKNSATWINGIQSASMQLITL